MAKKPASAKSAQSSTYPSVLPPEIRIDVERIDVPVDRQDVFAPGEGQVFGLIPCSGVASARTGYELKMVRGECRPFVDGNPPVFSEPFPGFPPSSAKDGTVDDLRFSFLNDPAGSATDPTNWKLDNAKCSGTEPYPLNRVQLWFGWRKIGEMGISFRRGDSKDFEGKKMT